MELILIGEQDVLTFLNDEITQSHSPEEFLSCLEEGLESGELTLDEVITLIHDFNHRC